LENSPLRFVVSSGGSRVREKLAFPDYYSNVLTASDVNLLVLCVTINGIVVGGCSLSGRFNMAVLYIREDYRGRGLATRLFRVTISIARERGDGFLTGAVPPWHVAAFGLDFKVGFRVIKRFKDFVLLLRPLNLKGEISYGFLRLVFSLLPDHFLTRAYNVVVGVEKKRTHAAQVKKILKA